jgi:hypothetical protein
MTNVLFQEQIRREITEDDHTNLDLVDGRPGNGRGWNVVDGIAMSLIPKVWVANEARIGMYTM